MNPYEEFWVMLNIYLVDPIIEDRYKWQKAELKRLWWLYKAF